METFAAHCKQAKKSNLLKDNLCSQMQRICLDELGVLTAKICQDFFDSDSEGTKLFFYIACITSKVWVDKFCEKNLSFESFYAQK